MAYSVISRSLAQVPIFRAESGHLFYLNERDNSYIWRFGD